MPLVKDPCVGCKEKHVKCDAERPKCSRCQTKGLHCLRPDRKSSFRHGSSAKYDARFSRNQSWVNSRAREFRHSLGGCSSRRFTKETETGSSRETPLGHLSTSPSTDLATTDARPEYATSTGANDLSWPYDASPQASPLSTNSLISLNHDGSTAPSFSPQAAGLLPSSLPLNNLHNPLTSGDKLPEYRSSYVLIERDSLQEREAIYHCQPFENIQDACLLRYFVEELAHWFDLCDEQKHFQLLVSLRARCYPPLLHAIFAVSARHLSRLQQYRTPQGILYHGQLLPNLKPSSAMEYMLKCIPALREFHEDRDEECRGHIIATAVILRQFEEMEDEEDEVDESACVNGRRPDICVHERVNFLAIINAVLRCSPSEDLFHQKGLFDAAYWMALRQEIYHSFTRGRSPQMVLAPEQWLGATMVNKLVMHTAQVARWLWDDKSEHEWMRLKDQEILLEKHISGQFMPIFKRQAYKPEGEVFPTIWYESEIAVTGIQHFMIAKMVLIAETPLLKTQPNERAAQRKMESDVRSIVLDLCGIALHHPRSPPALVNATIGILLYGDFFTDQWEREALMDIINKFKDVRAWPVPSALSSFKDRALQ